MKTKTTTTAVQVPAPEKQPPATSAELCERLRRLSEDMHRVSADLRYCAGFNTDQSEWGRQLWSFAAMPKIWAEKIEELEQK